MQQSTRTNTRTALLEAAQRLIAERGLGTLSVKDITQAAGARNPSAVHYHFGNVESLIVEIFKRRYEEIERQRLELLSKVNETDLTERLVALMEAALAPFIEGCLEKNGRLYAQFCVQLDNDPRFDLALLMRDTDTTGLDLLREQIRACLPDMPSATFNTRMRQAFSISLMQAADFARRLESGSDKRADAVIREAALTLAGYIAAPTK